MKAQLAVRTLLLTAAVGAAACGGGGGDKAAPPAVDRADNAVGVTTTTAPGSSPATDGGPGGTGGGSGGSVPTTTGTAPSGGGGSNPQATNEEQPPLPLEASLAKPCIRVGESQTITIKSLAKSAVGYDNYYPDGKSGIDREAHYGGNNGAVMPDSGTWSDSWVVKPNAPAGRVRVVYSGANVGYKAQQRELFYELVGPTGTCP